MPALRPCLAIARRAVKEEEVDLSDYRNFAEAAAQLGQFIDEVYFIKRIHSGLDYLTPAEFEAAWQVVPNVKLFSLGSA